MRSCKGEGGAFYSIEVHRRRTSKLVRPRQPRAWFIGSSPRSHCLPERKQILDSKSHKRLQELNLALDKRATELDDERIILGTALQDFSQGMALEQALYEVCAELTALEVHDVALRQRITQETEKLCQLEEKVRQISGCRLKPLNLPIIDCVYLWRRRFLQV